MATLAMTVAIAGCGPTLPHTPPGQAAPGNLVILAREVPDDRGTVYFEGSLRYVRVARVGGTAKEWQTVDGQESWMTVPPGQYEVEAWERVCGGNCDNLEPITNRCRTRLDIPVGGTGRVDITWTVPKPCVMTWGIGIS